MPESAARRLVELTSSGVVGLVGLLVAWKVFPYVAWPLFRLIVGTLHPGQYAF